MKAFLKKAVLYFLSYCIIIAIIPACILLFTPRLSAINFDGGLVIKKERLKKIENSQKIVFIGGSNLPYGLNSKAVEDSLHYKVVNFGHKFYYGLGFYLREIKDYLEEGDIVAIVPEYQMILDDYFSDREFNTVFWEGLHEKNIPFSDIIEMLPQTYTYFMYRYRNRNMKSAPENTVNRKSGFNEYGDMVCHWFWQRQAFNNHKAPPVIKIESRVYGEIRQFKKYCDEHHIKLALIPPMYSNGSFNNVRSLVDTTVHFWKTFGMEYSRPPAEYVLADTFFFDGPYHLRYEGVLRKTSMIIDDLKSIATDK